MTTKILLLVLFVSFYITTGHVLICKIQFQLANRLFSFLKFRDNCEKLNFVLHKTTYSFTSYSFPIGKYSLKPANSSNLPRHTAISTPSPLEFSISWCRLLETRRGYREQSIRRPILFRILTTGAPILSSGRR